jgi:WD40 repeat protein
MSIDYYPNSNYVVTASQNSDEDTGIRLWLLNGFEPIHQYDLQGGHSSTVNCVRFSPNGQFLASGADDHLVIVWTLKLTPVKFGEREESV